MITSTKDFSLLNKELKIQKLLNILEVFNGGDNIFSDIYDLFLELKNNLSDDFLVNIYDILGSIIKNITDENIGAKINKLEEVKNKFLEIKKIEQEEMLKEIQESELMLDLL